MDTRCRSTILIVEDDPDVVEANRILLEDEGYRAIIATDPRSGIERARTDRPDLILLDVMMPDGTEGFHFVWDLRRDSDPQLRSVPVIVLSAIHQTTPFRFYPDLADGCYGPYQYLPVQAFLDKPASSETLLAEIASALHNAEAAQPRIGTRAGNEPALGEANRVTS